MTTPSPEQTILFVGGAPRSGTTVLHQLLCTSDDTNAYHPEISFVVPLVNSFITGRNNWANHTNTFFGQPEHFRLHIAHHIEVSMQHISLVLGHPKVLTVKSPQLTPRFPAVRELLGERAKFMTTIRHPYTVVRSLQKVSERSNKEFTPAEARRSAKLYMSNYAHLDAPRLKGVEFVLRYEDILNTDVLQDMRAFTGLSDIDPDRMGNSKSANFSEAEKSNPWFSPKYHSKIDLTKRLSPLDERFRKIVYEICAPLMERFDYKDEA